MDFFLGGRKGYTPWNWQQAPLKMDGFQVRNLRTSKGAPIFRGENVSFPGRVTFLRKHPLSPGPVTSGPHMVDGLGLAPPVTPGSSRAASVPWWTLVVCGWGWVGGWVGGLYASLGRFNGLETHKFHGGVLRTSNLHIWLVLSTRLPYITYIGTPEG